jgi:hypothetical protein
MRRAARCLVGLVGLAGWLVPASAHAFDDGLVTVGGGVLGWTGANFLDEPGDQSIPGVPADDLSNAKYAGFAGTTLGFGFFTELRFFKYVGVELEVIPTHDKGSASMTESTNGTKTAEYKVRIWSDAMHVPLLLKGVLPGELVSGNIFLGPEFVIPEKLVDSGPSSGIEVQSGATSAQYFASGSTYTMFTFGLGLEINLPIPGVDIRLPLAIRGGYNPGVSDTRTDRATYVVQSGKVTETTTKTEWKWEALGTFGAGVHF